MGTGFVPDMTVSPLEYLESAIILARSTTDACALQLARSLAFTQLSRGRITDWTSHFSYTPTSLFFLYFLRMIKFAIIALSLFVYSLLFFHILSLHQS
uniref:Uncharacterized protein n=1 Tax=Octopus bimaculoides TaxID=37653 RepID=A0A0L8G3X6_OCTBM